MQKTSMLLVEDNEDDVQLTLRAFRKHNLAAPPARDRS